MFVRNMMGHLVPWESLTEQERAQWIARSSRASLDRRLPSRNNAKPQVRDKETVKHVGH